jgi:hypothetical protein
VVAVRSVDDTISNGAADGDGDGDGYRQHQTGSLRMRKELRFGTEYTMQGYQEEIEEEMQERQKRG